MNNSMMIRTKHKDIRTNVRSSLVEILNMMRFCQFDSITRLEVISAYLALVFIKRFQSICKPSIAIVSHLLHDLWRDFMLNGNAIMIENRRKRTIRAEFLRNA